MFDWITGIIGSIGALGVAALMFLENVFPPIPSELIMPLAGFVAANGGASFWVMVAAGTAGSLAGALLWYWIGARLGPERLRRLAARHGRWLTVAPDDIDRASDWFGRRGRAAVLLGRLVPTVRTFVSVPAGIAGMPLAPFVGYTLAGTLLWTALLAGAGYLLRAQVHPRRSLAEPRLHRRRRPPRRRLPLARGHVPRAAERPARLDRCPEQMRRQAAPKRRPPVPQATARHRRGARRPVSRERRARDHRGVAVDVGRV